MIHHQWSAILLEACVGTSFKPTARTDIQTIGHNRYFDGFVIDTRTDRVYSMGGIDFQQTPEVALEELTVKLTKLEARLTEYREAEARNKERLVR